MLTSMKIKNGKALEDMGVRVCGAMDTNALCFSDLFITHTVFMPFQQRIFRVACIFNTVIYVQRVP